MPPCRVALSVVAPYGVVVYTWINHARKFHICRLGNGTCLARPRGRYRRHLPAREAFETADALFTVEKRELSTQSLDKIELTTPDTNHHLPVFRCRQNWHSSTARRRFPSIRNRERFAPSDGRVHPRGGRHGRRHCSIGWCQSLFTATLRGAETDIVPGDTVKRRIVGYLGHDGKTGCGAKFTNIRVVCQNTLTQHCVSLVLTASLTKMALTTIRFTHQSIDVARQDFVTECELMREFSRTSMGVAQFNNSLMRYTTLTKVKCSASVTSLSVFTVGSVPLCPCFCLVRS